MNRTPLIVAGVLVLLIGAALVSWFVVEPREQQPGQVVTTTPSGLDDLIVVDAPVTNAVVTSPLMITGKARGNWYFEASFPVRILDAHGNELAVAPATAQSDWMTTSFVPFSLTLPFATSTTETGTLVLEKDNPSGLPEHDNALRIPIRFAVTSTPDASNTTSVKLFYYNPAMDQGPGGVQCSAKGLVAVTRTIPKSPTPLKNAIELLLQGKLTDAEKKQGITTEFPLADFALSSATVTDGVATLTFTDPHNNATGGACRVGVLWQQIAGTAMQFPTVQSVRFMPEELFQP